MKLRPVRAAVLLLLSGMALCAHAEETRRPYIIQLADQPVASYTGGVSGLRATQPGAGKRLNLAAADVRLYSDYLGQKQSAVKAVVAAAPILYDYKVVLNGFAAMLTDSEAQQLKANSAVASVVADTPRALQTSYTPTFLGLDQPGGLWSQLGGKEHAGENVVIGIIDGGVWPENPAYADRVDASGAPTFDNSGTLAYNAPLNWHGACDGGEGFGPANCNNKLIGARFFDTTFLSTGRSRHWSDFASPRDSLGDGAGEGGHGTHTSSTAGGNNGVATLVHGIPMGKASGMAPRARVAMYKVCWSFPDASQATGAKNSCWIGDSVAAIERAVLDGVHVLNFSIGGSDTINDPVEQAFLHAANAGVFVAASAGNDGPANTVSHLSPWLTTVAASTHNRLMKATVSLGNGASYTGASLNTTALPASPIVRSEDAGLAGRRCRRAAPVLQRRQQRRHARARPGQGGRQGGHLRARHQRPGRQEPGRAAGRRGRHGAGRQRRRPGRRGPLGAHRPPQRRRRRRRQVLRHGARRQRRAGRVQHRHQQRAGAGGGRLLLARAEPVRRQPAQARRRRPPASTSWPACRPI